MDTMTAISSWSGGKDSCLACYKAIGQGYRVECLLSFVSREYQRCCFHGIEKKLMNLQGESTGIPLRQSAVGRDMTTYEKEFKQAVTEIKKTGVHAMVFGDVYLEEHRQWVERVCNDLDITPVQPLWNVPPGEVVRDFIGSGFKAIIISCKADTFGKDFLGRCVDKELVEELERRKICPCGENGEFHTFVVDGPLFQKRIEILESEPVLRQGFWKHWFLDIKKYRAVTK
ncbi:diphthine--ammonia ligase [Verrucomicrobiota bacterium]